MKKYIIIAIMSLCAANCFADALDDLGRRLFGDRTQEFEFRLLPDRNSERYAVRGDSGKILVEGSTPSAMAVGLNSYLCEYAKVDVSWHALDSIVLPETLPMPERVLEGEARCGMRFFLNYCTFGYSMPFWQWSDWERLIDWMALQGVNMPLAITGQEAVWQRIWKSFGLDDDTIRSYFTGPAHLPWHRMLNVDRWEGPLPQSYIDSQEELQKKIVERERQLGMKPVLPAFAGHVPPELGKVYTDVTIHPMSKWGGLDPERYRAYFIEPSEALFDTIQRRFIDEQARTFGTDHIYGLDPFNEIEVPSWEEEYLHNASARICRSLRNADPDALWLQMSWMFHYMRREWTPERIEAFLTGVSPERLVLLDYYCDFKEMWKETEQFHGRPFIWCYLGNFGGNSFLVGDMDKIYARTEEAFGKCASTMAGIGGTLEGLDENPLIHSYALSRAWRHADADTRPEKWLESRAEARGGADDRRIVDAWRILGDSIYRSTSLSQGTLVNARPHLKGYGSWVTNNRYKYDNAVLAQAWQLLADADSDNPSHRYDVVNVGRQVLGNLFEKFRDRFTAAYEAGDIDAMRTEAGRMDGLIADLDRLLSTHPAFSFGKWLADARRCGATPEECDYYETNARRIVTTWGQPGTNLNDYANRDRSGLTGTFYRQRWRMFTDAVIGAAEEGREFTDADPLYTEMPQWEWQWTSRHDSFPVASGENPKELSRSLLQKYAPFLQ